MNPPESLSRDKRLPIFHQKEEILETIKNYPVVILEGPTGCGKTTQVLHKGEQSLSNKLNCLLRSYFIVHANCWFQIPQFIFDDAMQNKRRCNIVIVQPRRVAAQSNANRVTAERGCWPKGFLVGHQVYAFWIKSSALNLWIFIAAYAAILNFLELFFFAEQVGLDERANRSEHTRILFCTTGVLLEQLVRSAKTKNPLNGYTHIILDEVHERDKNMDFLFIVIKKLINPTVKVILMSATINSEQVSGHYNWQYSIDL